MCEECKKQIAALIAENERLKSLFDQSEKCIDRINALHQEAWVKKLGVSYPNYGGFPDNLEKLSIERDQLRAEIAGLRTGYEAYERVNAELKAEVEGLRKDADRLQSATAFVQKLCDSAGKQPSVATGYLHDILSTLGQGEQS